MCRYAQLVTDCSHQPSINYSLWGTVMHRFSWNQSFCSYHRFSRDPLEQLPCTPGQFCDNWHRITYFSREITADCCGRFVLKSVSHHNRVFLVQVYIAMEMAGHGDLLEYIKLRGAIPEDKAKKMFQQLVNAIEYLHSLCIIHRQVPVNTPHVNIQWTVYMCFVYCQPQVFLSLRHAR